MNYVVLNIEQFILDRFAINKICFFVHYAQTNNKIVEILENFQPYLGQ